MRLLHQQVAGMAEGFKSKDLGVQIQKKLFSRMANKNIAKILIDDAAASALDNLYRLAKFQYGNKKEAEKLLKKIIKIVVKIGILGRNNSFNEEEMKHVERFKTKFHAASMSVISFYEVDFSYDRNYLISVLHEAQDSLVNFISRHLTDKSIGKVDFIFNFFCDPSFLDAVFKPKSECRPILRNLVKDLNTMLEQEGL